MIIISHALLASVRSRGQPEIPEEEWHMSCLVADLHVTGPSRDSARGNSPRFPSPTKYHLVISLAIIIQLATAEGHQ